MSTPKPDIPLDPSSRELTHGTAFYRAGRSLCQMVIRIFYDFKTYGRENVPRRGGVLLVSNHESFFDPVLVGIMIVRPLSFLAKADLFRNRLFGWILLRLGAFPVRRGEGDVGAIKEAIRRLKEGRMLNVFPEGGRSRTGMMREFQPGFTLFIRRAGACVVPVAVEGSYQAWPHGQRFPGRGRMRVMYGKPLDVAGASSAEIVRILRERIASMAAELERRSRAER